jgi:hypothetical protein
VNVSRELAWAAALSLAGCTSAPEPERPRQPAAVRAETPRAPVLFSYRSTDGRELSHRTTRGRATALIFLTTYDPASQVQAEDLDRVLRARGPSVSGGAIMLEPESYAVLADVFRQTLELSFPVAVADPATLRGEGPFGRVRQVPTTFVLDKRGRIVWSKIGRATPAELDRALTSAQR